VSSFIKISLLSTEISRHAKQMLTDGRTTDPKTCCLRRGLCDAGRKNQQTRTV